MGEVMDAVREMQKGGAIKGVALSHRHFLLLDGGSPHHHHLLLGHFLLFHPFLVPKENAGRAAPSPPH